MKYQEAVNRANVLVLSDDRLVQKSLYEMLCRAGYTVDVAGSIEETLNYLNENPHRVVLADAIETGHSLLKLSKKNKHHCPVIILDSYGNIDSAVESIKRGASDYIAKPVEDKNIIDAIEKAFSSIPPSLFEFGFIKNLLKKEKIYNGIVGCSQQMSDIYSIIERIANTKATILLRGESGTGKRMIAHAIHKADKKRRDKSFIEISCGALPKEIIESELFGHTKGAFTGAINDRKGRFELADGGTLLLDDIDSFSLDMQVKLLRVLQEREFERVGDHKTMKVDLRVIVTTNQDLEKAISEGRFREDLYYRLNVISIDIPPLRERKDDLPLLVEHFVNIHSKENHKKVKEISSEVLGILMDYNWPGNIRELENILERAVILDIDGIIDSDDLPEIILNGVKVLSGDSSIEDIKDFSSLKDALKEPEKVHILRVLQEVGWNKKKAASKLGVNRTTLYNKLKRYKLLSQCAKE
ncbi:MAG: sigma-54 dependent transcriptional regulator [Candidatus Omnitrophota bacterium]